MKASLFSRPASFGLIFLLISSTSLVADPVVVDLRGYGKVSADLTPTRSVFACESVGKADILLDKLVSDLFWDNTLPMQKGDLKIGTNTVMIYTVEGYGYAVIARAGKNVVVVGGDNEDQVVAQVAKEPLLEGPDVTSQAAKPHPLFLDFYDNKAFKSYVIPMRSRNNYGIESHWPFLNSIGAGECIHGPSGWCISPAPGVNDWTAEDYELQAAEKQNGLIVFTSVGGGRVPLWGAEEYPGSMMKPSPTSLLGDWGGVGAAGGAYESWSTPLNERMQMGLGFLEQAMQRYGSSPSLGGWQLYAGAPGEEYNFHGHATTRVWDYSDAGQEGWRSWLRDERHLSLADLGTRWYGDPHHFSSWDEVTVPDLNQFYGQMGPDSFQVDSGWRWQNLDQPASAPIASDDPGWVPVDRPPSLRQAFLDSTGFNYFDVTFDPSAWLKQKKDGASVWLVFGLDGTGPQTQTGPQANGIHVWFNDKEMDLPKDRMSKNVSFAVDLTSLLTAGSNHLQVSLNCAVSQLCAGKLAGPVFLTTHEPQRLPNLGPGANALSADFADWQCWAMTDYHRKMFDLARKLDPDRPILLAGGANPLFDYTVHLAVDYGLGVENTGREANYYPWLPGYGLAAGFYATSEWSTSPQGDALDKGFAWMLFDADSSHCYDQDIEDAEKREKEGGWFTRHHRQVQLFGKYLQVQPGVALLDSSETDRLTYPLSNTSDIGRGEIEAAHYGDVYISEDGLKKGLADRYPVLFDIGSQFMEKDTVEAIRQYVEQGGTFVALNNTGIDTALEPNSYPISDLSGFKVTGTSEHGTIQFASTLPFFQGWEGKEFEGQGQAIDWLNEDHAKEDNLGFAPDDSSSIPLARWEDGSVAIGYRKVGKGQIITLGSTFWRDGKDVSGVWRTSHELEAQFFEKLFTACGVLRNANASIPEIWARKMVTKNGLQNWLMTINTTNAPQNADVWMATDGQPKEVIDLDTNTSVPFVYENNGVTIQNVHYESYAVKAFAVARATIAGGLPIWWGEKTTYWKQTPAEIAAAAMTLPQPDKTLEEPIIPLHDWRFHTDEDHAIAHDGKWIAVDFDDSGWAVKNAGPWNLCDPALKDYHGTGLYRVKFTISKTWTGRRILLNLYDFDTPIVYDDGEFSINGTHVASYKAHGWSQTLNYDVTDLVHPGDNVLTLEDTAGPKYGGLGTDAIWIESRVPLAPVLDLSGTWQTVQDDWLTHSDLTVPSQTDTKAKYITRDIAIPADWKGRNIYLEWSTQRQWMACVVINGHPINYNSFVHPYGLISRINVTPYLNPGATNTIEIWPLNSINHHNGKDTAFQFNSIDIGCQ